MPITYFYKNEENKNLISCYRNIFFLTLLLPSLPHHTYTHSCSLFGLLSLTHQRILRTSVCSLPFLSLPLWHLKMCMREGVGDCPYPLARWQNRWWESSFFLLILKQWREYSWTRHSTLTWSGGWGAAKLPLNLSMQRGPQVWFLTIWQKEWKVKLI